MIDGNIIYLRAMEPEDMELYRDMINDNEISKNVVGWSYPVSRLEQMKWYEHSVEDINNLRFTIVMKEDNMAVGVVNLVQIDLRNRSAKHGIKLHPKCPKRIGIGTDAVMTIMKYAFEEMGLHRIETTRIDYNEASRNLYEKVGWKTEGIKRDAVYRGGKYHDLVMMSILKEDYLNVKKRLGR